ncbi:hypothetical protein ACIOJ9_29060 [Streptomyces sp. NPDC088175]|uniref:hypothetical protein n=1 Tax=unclassified Streptomyces TaxID=2593676 RepID=UPI00380EFA72
MRTTAHFDNGDTAIISHFKDLGQALYNFGNQGKIHVQPGFFGQSDRLAVTISLGRPGDTSGYGLTGLTIGDWLLTGTVMATGGDFTPHPHPHTPTKFPLADIDDPTARQAAADHLAQIAQHFHSTFA